MDQIEKALGRQIIRIETTDLDLMEEVSDLFHIVMRILLKNDGGCRKWRKRWSRNTLNESCFFCSFTFYIDDSIYSLCDFTSYSLINLWTRDLGTWAKDFTKSLRQNQFMMPSSRHRILYLFDGFWCSAFLRHSHSSLSADNFTLKCLSILHIVS